MKTGAMYLGSAETICTSMGRVNRDGHSAYSLQIREKPRAV